MIISYMNSVRLLRGMRVTSSMSRTHCKRLCYPPLILFRCKRTVCFFFQRSGRRLRYTSSDVVGPMSTIRFNISVKHFRGSILFSLCSQPAQRIGQFPQIAEAIFFINECFPSPPGCSAPLYPGVGCPSIRVYTLSSPAW